MDAIDIINYLISEYEDQINISIDNLDEICQILPSADILLQLITDEINILGDFIMNIYNVILTNEPDLFNINETINNPIRDMFQRIMTEVQNENIPTSIIHISFISKLQTATMLIANLYIN